MKVIPETETCCTH